MFSLLPFELHFCKLGRTFPLVVNACDPETYLGFIPGPLWRGVKAHALSCLYNEPLCYPYCYWSLLLLSVFGSLQGMYAFLGFFCKESKTVSIWHNRRFHVVPDCLKRPLGYLKTFVTTNAWTVLAYATLYVSPPHMLPIIFCYGFIFAIRLIVFFAEMLLVRQRYRFMRSISNLISIPVLFFFVLKCYTIFLETLKVTKLDDLMLFHRWMDEAISK